MADNETACDWPYAEALPRFNVLTLGKQWRTGARLLFWYDQDRHQVGGASFDLDETGRNPDPPGVDMSFAFERDDGYVNGGKDVVRFEIVYRTDGERPSRLAILCPKCRRRCEVLLFFMYKWRCRKCHGVKNLTNNIDTNTALYQQYIALDKMVKTGRPKGMRHATHARLLAERKRLKAAFRHQPARTLSAAHHWRVNERYFKPGSAPHPDEPEPPRAGHPSSM